MEVTSLIILLAVISLSGAFILDENCPDCNWNGVCNTHSGHCGCYDGYQGTDCNVDCGCQGNGVCNQDNTCKCDSGWKWSSTDHKCVWDCQCSNGEQCIGPGVCGCTHACDFGTCWQGQCECWAGYKGNTCGTYDSFIMINRNISVGMNIGGLSYWTPETKFVDITRQSQEWITQRLEGPHVHNWDTKEYDNITWRSDGYPASLEKSLVIGKLMLRGEAGIHGPQGNFTVLYDGDGELNFKLTKHTIHHNGKGRLVVEFNVNKNGIFLMIMRTNPNNPIHNIRVIIPGFEERHALFPFYPPFLENLARYSELRFMDFFHTNSHKPEPTTWSTRRLNNFHTQTGEHGAALEYAIQLANILGANPWFNIPHAADDNFVTEFANMAKSKLRPDLKIYVEYSNEVWNGIFRQTKYTQERGVALGLDTLPYKAGMKFYNKRSTEVVKIWKQVFSSVTDRLVNVWAWQTGYQDYTKQELDGLGSEISTFDALAITGYFDCDQAAYKQNFTSMPAAEVAQLCTTEVAKSEASFKHYMDVAKNHSVKLLMYEGGPGMETSRSHDDTVTSHAIDFHRHALMETAVADTLEAWHSVVNSDPYNTFPGGLFNYFSSVSAYSKYGSWGLLEYTGQDPNTSPKYMALQKYISRYFNNTYVGPIRSFAGTSEKTVGCFIETGSHVCGITTDTGNSWKHFPNVPVSGVTYVLDGYNSHDGSVYVRTVDKLAVNTYFVLDSLTKNSTWTKLTFAEYYRQLASPRVTFRQPEADS